MVQSEEIRREFVKRLKQALAKSGIAEWGAGSRLAEITGKTPKAASKWLNGEAMPGRANMQVIADELHVSIQWLQYGEGKILPSNAGNESNIETALRPATANDHKENAAAKVLEMLQKHGKGLPTEVRQKIVDAVVDSHSEPEPSPNPPSTLATAGFTRGRALPGEISIPQYDVRGSMGHGQLPDEYVRHIRNVIISEEMLHELGVKYTSTANLCFMTGWGQSMEGTINDKDPLLVDRGVQTFIGDGVYAFTWEGFFHVKRLQILDAEHLEIISDNEAYKPRKAKINDLHIHARVLVAWNAKRL